MGSAEEAGRIIRAAIRQWATTLRLITILLAVAIPALLLVLLLSH